MTGAVVPAFNAVARMATIRARVESITRSATLTTGAAPSTTALGAGDFSSILEAATRIGGPSAPAATDLVRTGPSIDPSQVVDTAKEYLGIPYVWGGTDPKVGLDCSGFLKHVFGRLGIDLPRTSRQQATAGTPVASLEEARPGDIIAFGQPVDHIAIYVGDGKIIHAPHTGDVVKIAPIHRTPTAIRRLVPDSGPGAFNTVDPLQTTSAALMGSGLSSSVARFSSLFSQAGAKWGVSPKVLAAVAQVESGGNPNARSPAGALGLMQFMPATARSFGIDPLVPGQAIDAAAKYLTQQRDAFGSLELALASYNAGPGAVRRYGGIPPYPETQAYVRKVMSNIGAGT